jgi:histidine triad (HIT) family protein
VKDFVSDCIFCKIAAGQIPCKKVYEDDDVIAFHDLHPVAPVHFMIIPKEHIASLDEAHARHEMLLGHILLLAPILAKEQGLVNGFRIVINNGPGGGQEVYHLHAHVFGGDAPHRL